MLSLKVFSGKPFEDARHAIEEFLAKKGFELPLVHVCSERALVIHLV